MTKELKKDKLYLLDTEYEFEDDEGRQVICHDKLVGYVLAEDNVFFKGGIYSFQTGRSTWYYEGEMSLTVQEFNKIVKKITVIA